jgi:hypothetical protein
VAASRNKIISSRVIPTAAADAARIAQIQAEMFVLRPSDPPAHTHNPWLDDEEPAPSLLDTMGRWSVPMRRRRPGSVKAMTLADLQARARKVEALAAINIKNMAREAKGSARGRSTASIRSNRPLVATASGSDVTGFSRSAPPHYDSPTDISQCGFPVHF